VDESRYFLGFQKGDEIKFDAHNGQSWMLFFHLCILSRNHFGGFGVI